MNSEHRVVVLIVMEEYVRNLRWETTRIQKKRKCGWFMGYFVVRTVVGYGTETVTVPPISTRLLIKRYISWRDQLIYVEKRMVA